MVTRFQSTARVGVEATPTAQRGNRNASLGMLGAQTRRNQFVLQHAHMRHSNSRNVHVNLAGVVGRCSQAESNTVALVILHKRKYRFYKRFCIVFPLLWG